MLPLPWLLSPDRLWWICYPNKSWCSKGWWGVDSKVPCLVKDLWTLTDFSLHRKTCPIQSPDKLLLRPGAHLLNKRWVLQGQTCTAMYKINTPIVHPPPSEKLPLSSVQKAWGSWVTDEVLMQLPTVSSVHLWDLPFLVSLVYDSTITVWPVVGRAASPACGGRATPVNIKLSFSSVMLAGLWGLATPLKTPQVQKQTDLEPIDKLGTVAQICNPSSAKSEMGVSPLLASQLEWVGQTLGLLKALVSKHKVEHDWGRHHTWASAFHVYVHTCRYTVYRSVDIHYTSKHSLMKTLTSVTKNYGLRLVIRGILTKW